jgi:ribosomal protein L14E/L6E/L27E
MIVRSVKGHDVGQLFVIIACDGRYVYVANGKTRKMASPKKKNKRHIIVTETKQQNLSELTDKSLRRLINKLKTIYA